MSSVDEVIPLKQPPPADKLSVRDQICKQPKRKKNYGRSARRRRAKIRTIRQAEEEAILRSETGESSPADGDGSTTKDNHRESQLEGDRGGCPNDRGETLPSVLSLRKELRFSIETDGIQLTRQLGFLPGNAVCVAARDSCGIPTVLKLYPLAVRNAYKGGKSDGRKFKSRQRGHFDEHADAEQDMPKKPSPERGDESSKKRYSNNSRRDWRTEDNKGVIEPFPTLYWLTCPKLRMLISNIENSSHGFPEKLKNDPESLKSMKEAHYHYGKQRWDLLSHDDKEKVIERGWGNALGPERGVAGIRRVEGIKCLHAHAAHYLAGGKCNVVGKWVLESAYKLTDENH